MGYDIIFGHKKQGELRNTGEGHYKLQGTLLPWQFIRITWWSKEHSNKWQQEIGEAKEK